MTSSASAFAKLRAEDARNERRLLWSEVGIVALMAFLVMAYLVLA